MTFKCTECGHIFEEGEEFVWIERHGFDFGGEEFSGCPLCHGEYEKTIPCEVCGSEHLPDELFGGVCEECIDKCRHDVDMCAEVGAENREEVKINSFLLSIFDGKDIEAILFEHLKERFSDVDCSAYIDNDMSWFGEQLVAQEAHL